MSTDHDTPLPIGTTVAFRGNANTGACTGRVVKTWREPLYAPDADWSGDDDPQPIGLGPWSQARVRIHVDVLPARWPWGDRSTFTVKRGELDVA